MMSVCQLFFHYSFVSMSPPPVLLQILEFSSIVCFVPTVLELEKHTLDP